MAKVYKYELAIQDHVTILVAPGAKFMHVGEPPTTNAIDPRPHALEVWYLVEPAPPTAPRRFRIFGTGQEVPSNFGLEERQLMAGPVFRGTVVMRHHPLVWHVWEVLP